MARYLWDEKTHKLELIDPHGYKDPNQGLNGPIFCPDGGYFDKALQRRFGTKSEKREFMRQHGLKMEGSDKNYKGVEAEGVGKRYYSFGGMKTCNRGYKYR